MTEYNFSLFFSHLQLEFVFLCKNLTDDKLNKFLNDKIYIPKINDENLKKYILFSILRNENCTISILNILKQYNIKFNVYSQINNYNSLEYYVYFNIGQRKKEVIYFLFDNIPNKFIYNFNLNIYNDSLLYSLFINSQINIIINKYIILFECIDNRFGKSLLKKLINNYSYFDFSYNTFFHFVCMYGNSNFINSVIYYGADYKLKDSENHFPFEQLNYKDLKEIVSIRYESKYFGKKYKSWVLSYQVKIFILQCKIFPEEIRKIIGNKIQKFEEEEKENQFCTVQ